MKCYKHNEREIVVQCHGCGKGLCHECSTRFNVILCQDCLLASNESYKKTLIRNFVLMAILFYFGFTWILPDGGFWGALFFGYLMASVPWGWMLLNRITPDIFLILPLIGWVIYFFMKVFLSGMIGFFMAPYKIYKTLQEYKDIKTVKQQVQSGSL